MPAFRTIMYCHYYTIELIEETVPAMFTVRSLDLVSDYLFYELFELMDLRFVHDQFEDGCRQIHVLPRFTRPLPGKSYCIHLYLSTFWFKQVNTTPGLSVLSWRSYPICFSKETTLKSAIPLYLFLWLTMSKLGIRQLRISRYTWFW